MKISSTSGLSLVEVLIASAIISVSIASIMGAYGGLTALSIKNTPYVQAAMLLEEGAEAVKMMRDSGWSQNINTLTNGTPYGFTWAAATGWRATSTIPMIDSFFYRTVTLTSVSRDSGTFDIVSTGGTTDANTRKATISVSWLSNGATTTRSLDMYIHNRFSN